MSEIINWLSINPIANSILTTLIAVVPTILVLIVVVAFAQNREISFWPPKIGPKPIKINTHLQSKNSVGQSIKDVLRKDLSLDECTQIAYAFAPFLVNYILLEFVKWINTYTVHEKMRSGKYELKHEIQPFLSFVRKQIFEDMEMLGNSIIHNTSFELADVLYAVFYTRSTIDSIDSILGNLVAGQKAPNGRIDLRKMDLETTSRSLESLLRRSFERAVSSPRQVLLNSIISGTYEKKYEL